MLRAASLLLALTFLLALPAWAGRRVIVLDRGKAAKADRTRHDAVARALLDDDTILVFTGTREDGRSRVGEIRANHEEAIASERLPLGWGFEGGSDPRKALEYVARRAGKDEPLDVFLVGPFENEDDATGWGETWRKAWRDRAPEGSRFFPVGLGKARLALIDDLPGRASDGWIVLGAEFQDAEVGPWSPLDADAPGIHVTLTLRVQAAAIGVGATRAPMRVESVDPAAIEARMTSGGLRADVSIAQPRNTLRARVRPADGVLWLAGEIAPIEVALRPALRRDARLVPPKENPTFVALDVRADEPVSWVYRLLRSDTGDRAALRVSNDLPPGLSIEVGETMPHDPFVVRNDVRVTFRPLPGRPVDTEGVIRIDEPGSESSLSLPYRVEAPRGKVRVTLQAPDEAQPLPWFEDTPWSVRIERLDANAPEEIRLALETEPEEIASRLTASLETAGKFDLRLRVNDAAPLGEAATVTLRTDADADVEIVGRGRIRERRPTLLVQTTDDGLVLEAKPDGGDDTWRARVFAALPTIASPAHNYRWAAREIEPGRWRVEAAEVDPATRPGIFSDHEVTIPLEIAWAPGDVPDAVSIRHVTPARWGGKGFVLVALALLAAALGAGILWSMRAPPVEGTLLYAIEGVEGAVGRLDLAPVGRGRVELRAGRKGVLRLGGDGDLIGKVAATRVGGFLELSEERLLLVDGLTVETGRHRLRYVSGFSGGEGPAPDLSIPDLLGPEFDLKGGRIEGEAAGAPERS